jgi:hypothetical protein
LNIPFVLEADLRPSKDEALIGGLRMKGESEENQEKEREREREKRAMMTSGVG